MDEKKLAKICKLIRYDILTSTTNAGSGHPTSSLSAVELMTTLFFNGFLKYDLKNPHYIFNDRVIFSKGHAAPLLYALYHTAGVISYKEIMSLRQFGSRLEGHPTPRFPYVDVATGSLGQGLSIGLGMALGIKLRIKREPKVFVLLGDSEMAEGQIWEALETASFYKLNNLVGILDVNRLGQTGETMYGWGIKTYEKRIDSFGWNTIVIADGHDLKQISASFNQLQRVSTEKPTMIIAKTIKGKGISFLENKLDWHGKTLSKEQLNIALKELGKINHGVKGMIEKPEKINIKNDGKGSGKMNKILIELSNYALFKIKSVDPISTRKAFGDSLVSLGKQYQDIVVFDGETSNSTYTEEFRKSIPERFFEMYIEEAGMISAALGIAKLDFAPFVSTFAAFLTRGFDQIRMAQYSSPNLKIVGSHAGVSIGQDGPSQMGLEDISMMRSIVNSVVLYPSDGISAKKLTELMYKTKGISYLRTTRGETPVIYDESEKFYVGGLKILKRSNKDTVVIVAAGITLHEALKAYYILQKKNIFVTVVDLYSVKPLDEKTLHSLSKKTKHFIVVEDHYPAGGLGEAIRSVLNSETMKQCNNFVHLAVNKIPRSGKPEELLSYEEIDAEAIIRAVKKLRS